MSDFLDGYFAADAHQDRAISVKRFFIDLCDGNLPQAVMLSQIYYWHRNDKQGNPRMKVVKEGHRWIAKTYPEWSAETGIPDSTVRKAINDLVKCGLIVKNQWQFNGTKTTHIRLDRSTFEQMLMGNLTVKSLSAKIEQMGLLKSSKPNNIDDNRDVKDCSISSKNEDIETPPMADVADTSSDSEINLPTLSEPVEGLIDAGSPSPPNSGAPPSPQPLTQQQKFGGICTALGWDPANLPADEKGRVGKAAKGLPANVRISDFARFRKWNDTINDWRVDSAEGVTKAWAKFCRWKETQPDTYKVIEPIYPDGWIKDRESVLAPANIPPEVAKQRAEEAAILMSILDLTHSCPYDSEGNITPYVPSKPTT